MCNNLRQRTSRDIIRTMKNDASPRGRSPKTNLTSFDILLRRACPRIAWELSRTRVTIPFGRLRLSFDFHRFRSNFNEGCGNGFYRFRLRTVICTLLAETFNIIDCLMLADFIYCLLVEYAYKKNQISCLGRFLTMKPVIISTCLTMSLILLKW